ncbi:hypothetical protein ADZ37_24755 [Pannonibacter phragmitetus]|jgi:hypothetical protein|uniref:hypothetical protein n=1 Tax=Pannonibacter phragmitetus TaxID=121719 RepID=UPI00067C8910|nr:hypothetical protein [Pannonibacter phragmitetus]KND16149.1 hypothetical protein ADZ37_24755 [Pannonibacter phragmitetus]MBC7164528.1 hypothetical protein [Roseovarius sp.]
MSPVLFHFHQIDDRIDDCSTDEKAGRVNDIAPTPRIARLRHHPVHDRAALEALAQGNGAGIPGQAFGTVLDAKRAVEARRDWL